MLAESSEIRALNALRLTTPELADDVAQYLSKSLSHFLHRQWHTTGAETSLSKAARKIFISRLTSHLTTQLPSTEVQAALDDFLSAPIVQTGPHCDLFLDPTAFYTMICSVIGAKAASRDHIFVHTCGRVTFETKAKFGPGWINVGPDSINLFGLSRRQLIKSTVSAFDKPVSFQEPNQNIINQNAEEYHYLDRLFKVLPNKTFTCPENAFETANHALWQDWGGHKMVKLITFCDDFYSDLLADFLEEGYEVLDRIIFTSSGRADMEAAMERITRHPAAFFFSTATDYFWLMKNNRFRRLKIDGDVLREVRTDGKETVTIPLNRRAIVSALRDRVLAPNLLLHYVISSVLPRICALGGLRLLGYYPLYHNFLIDILDKNRHEEQSLFQELSSPPQFGWCMALKTGGRQPLSWLSELPQGKQIEKLAIQLGAESVRTTTCGLAAFHSHPEWGMLISSLEHRQ